MDALAGAGETCATGVDGDGNARLWRRWLRAFLLTTARPGCLLCAGVMPIDPFSTGRFSLVQGIDIASRNARLIKGGVARDLRFDAAIFDPLHHTPAAADAVASTIARC